MPVTVSERPQTTNPTTPSFPFSFGRFQICKPEIQPPPCWSAVLLPTSVPQTLLAHLPEKAVTMRQVTAPPSRNSNNLNYLRSRAEFSRSLARCVNTALRPARHAPSPRPLNSCVKKRRSHPATDRNQEPYHCMQNCEVVSQDAPQPQLGPSRSSPAMVARVDTRYREAATRPGTVMNLIHCRAFKNSSTLVGLWREAKPEQFATLRCRWRTRRWC